MQITRYDMCKYALAYMCTVERAVVEGYKLNFNSFTKYIDEILTLSISKKQELDNEMIYKQVSYIHGCNAIYWEKTYAQ